ATSPTSGVGVCGAVGFTQAASYFLPPTGISWWLTWNTPDRLARPAQETRNTSEKTTAPTSIARTLRGKGFIFTSGRIVSRIRVPWKDEGRHCCRPGDVGILTRLQVKSGALKCWTRATCGTKLWAGGER